MIKYESETKDAENLNIKENFCDLLSLIYHLINDYSITNKIIPIRNISSL